MNEGMKVKFVDLRRQYHQIKTEIDSAIEEVLEQYSFSGGLLWKHSKPILLKFTHQNIV